MNSKTLYIPPHHEGLHQLSRLGHFNLFFLHVNVAFAAAILEAIENHNDAIRQEALQELCEEDEDQDSEPEQPGTES